MNLNAAVILLGILFCSCDIDPFLIRDYSGKWISGDADYFENDFEIDLERSSFEIYKTSANPNLDGMKEPVIKGKLEWTDLNRFLLIPEEIYVYSYAWNDKTYIKDWNTGKYISKEDFLDYRAAINSHGSTEDELEIQAAYSKALELKNVIFQQLSVGWNPSDPDSIISLIQDYESEQNVYLEQFIPIPGLSSELNDGIYKKIEK